MLKLEGAIDNNGGLYRAVFDACGKVWRHSPVIDYCNEQAPPFYSSLVTRAPNWTPDEVFRAIDGRARREAWPDWSIKDSFNKLDLAPFGFQALFRAHWLYRDSTAAPAPAGTIDFVRVSSATALSEWTTAWGGAPGEQIFRPALLANRDFHVVSGFEDGVIVCGFIANRTGAIVGLSNFFGEASRWPAAVDYCRTAFENTDLVGYERDPAIVEILLATGFEIVGDLAVWLLQP